MDTNKLYTSKQIKEKLNIDNSELAKLRSKGLIQFEKVNSRKFIYELNEELEKEFIRPSKPFKNQSTTSEEEFVEYELDDSALEFPQVRSYYQYMKEQRKLNSFQERDQYIQTYRKLSMRPEVQNSIEEILNEMLSPYDDGQIVKIDYADDNENIKDATKKVVTESFEKCIKKLDFQNNAFSLANDWYVDGLLPMECVYDNAHISKGITDVIKLTPIYLRDFKDENTKKPLYKFEKNLQTINHFKQQDYKDVYKEEQMISVGSGLWDEWRVYELSYLRQALKAINDLAHIENSIVKYRITRASEKNVWNVDVGTMARQKAENHLSTLAREISSNLRYNTDTGETNLDSTEGITDDWLFPSRNGKQKTSVETINGNSDFISKLEDLEYFRRKMYEAMKIPVGRLDGDSSLDYSAMDILREELKFVKFITRLRNKFSNIFYEFMQRDLIAQKKITLDEWMDIKQDIYIKWNQSNQIIENAELENMQKRFEIIQEIEDSGVVGKYIPVEYIVDRILKMTEDEFKEYQKKIEKERKEGFHKDENED